MYTGMVSRFFAGITLWLLIILLPVHASATSLVSQFLSADAEAIQVMSGSPYDMTSQAWINASSDQIRDSFAYKIFSALFMLGYQTEISYMYNISWKTPHLLALHAFQSRNTLPVSDQLDSNCLALIDQQLTQREQLLAPLGQPFLLYDHMQLLHVNDISKDTLAAIYSLPMSVLPQSLQMDSNESVQCIGGQCNGFIQDAAGNNLQSWPTPIDPASDYRFVGAYFDPLKSNTRLPSAAVHVDTVLHEYGHYLDGFLFTLSDPLLPKLGLIDTSGYYSISYDLSDHISTCYLLKSSDPKDWITKYAAQLGGYGNCSAGRSVVFEDWAESFATYVAAGRDFRAAASPTNLDPHPMIAQKYDWLKVNVFNGVEYDTDLPRDLESGCNDVYGTSSAQPGYLHCNDDYVWNFTLPLRQGGNDDTPKPFTFASQVDVDLTTAVQADTQVQVEEINTAAPITVSGGEYSINSGNFTNAAGWINNGDLVSVRLTSSASYSTTTKAILMIGGVSGSFSVTTKTPTPTISGNPSWVATQGAAYHFTPTASHATSFTISNQPAWANFDTTTGTLSGTPATTGMFNNIVITANNSSGSAVLPSYNITVSPAHPTISGTPAATVILGVSYTFIPTLDYWTGLQLSGDLPPGLTFNYIDGSISGTATAPGIYGNLSLTAINGVFAASLPPFSITVLPPTPTIEGTPPTIAAVLTSYSFTPTATNCNSFQISDNLPPGLIFDKASGNLSGKPTTPGIYGNIVITALLSANILTLTADLPAFTITVSPVIGTFTAASDMTTARQSHTSTLLPNGKILVTGGNDLNYSSLALSELYDQVNEKWISVGHDMTDARVDHSAVLLNNGKVLVLGGSGSNGALASSELYNPDSDDWSPTGSMSDSRSAQTATLLPNGKVLVVGGIADNPLASAEIFDPATGLWTTTDSMKTPRFYFNATGLKNGKVLVVGGYDESYNSIASAEIYDPGTGKWSSTGAMTTPRSFFSATLLANGRVLVAGGSDSNGNVLASAEIYDPATGIWLPAPSMSMARNLHSATLLNYGVVLVAGGSGSFGMLDSAELYDPANNTWKPAGPLAISRYFAGATLLENGKVLISGGSDMNGSLSGAELYSPPPISHDGIIRSAGNKLSPDISDALMALRQVVGLITLSSSQLVHADVFPLGQNGKPVGDGVVNMQDVLLILRHATGRVNW